MWNVEGVHFDDAVNEASKSLWLNDQSPTRQKVFPKNGFLFLGVVPSPFFVPLLQFAVFTSCSTTRTRCNLYLRVWFVSGIPSRCVVVGLSEISSCEKYIKRSIGGSLKVDIRSWQQIKKYGLQYLLLLHM